MSASDHLNPRLFDPGPALTPEEQQERKIQKQARELAQFGEVRTSTDVRSAKHILAEGAIKTQHETGFSQGEYNPHLRTQLEEDMGFEANPVYGYLARDPNEFGHYGRVDFHLDSSVKERTSAYAGDTLTDHDLVPGEIPVPTPIPELRSGTSGIDRSTYYHEDDLTELPYIETLTKSDSRPETLGYPKRRAGVTARVPVSDIHRMTIGPPDPVDPLAVDSPLIPSPASLELGAAAAAQGIPVDYRVEDLVTQPELDLMDPTGIPYPKGPHRHHTRDRLVRHEDLDSQSPWRH